MVNFAPDFCSLLPSIAVTPAQHLLSWFTPERRKLVNSSAIDRQAKKTTGNFANFLHGRKNTTLERAGVEAYYPVLMLLGYLPPSEFWVPTRTLSTLENSPDIKTWFTPERQELINLTQLDILSGRSRGHLRRYLKGEPHITFKILGLQVYYTGLQQVGFMPPTHAFPEADNLISEAAAQHLLTWFTPERRKLLSAAGLDELVQQPPETFAHFLAGYRRASLPLASVEAYYTALRAIGYHPGLDLDKDESVQRYRQEKARN